MKKILISLITVTLVIFESYQEQGSFLFTDAFAFENKSLQYAFNNKQSDLQIRGSGVVIKVLRDDTDGSRHQKFILRTNTGQSL